MYECDRCDYATPDKSNFKKHLLKKKPCPAIKSTISMESMLEKLTKREGDYVCDECDKVYTSRQGLYLHKINFHNVPKKKDVSIAPISQPIAPISQPIVPLSQPMAPISQPVDSDIVLTLQRQLKNANQEIEKLKAENSEVAELRKSLNNSIAKVNNLEMQIGFLKEKKNEDFYQKIVETHLNGKHKRLTIGVTDVTNDTTHAEIKRWEYFKKAIGQLVAYNIEDPKDRLQAYFFGNCEKKNMDNAANCVKKANMEVYTFRFPTPDEIEIIEYFSEECVFSYKI